MLTQKQNCKTVLVVMGERQRQDKVEVEVAEELEVSTPVVTRLVLLQVRE